MAITLGKKIGEGEFADLYEGTDVSLGRKVAVKLFRPSMGNAQFIIGQAKALGRVPTHPNVVILHAVEELAHPDTGQKVSALVMEHLDGKTLSDFLKLNVSASECLRFGEGVIDGVEHIHKQGLVHGDLHPENIMIGLGFVKVIDIHYEQTLAQSSTMSTQGRVAADLVQLINILALIAGLSQPAPEQLAIIYRCRKAGVSVHDIRSAFRSACDPSVATSAPVLAPVDHGLFARVKSLLPDDNKYIELDDIAREQTDRVLSTISGQEFSAGTPEPSQETIPVRAVAYESAVSELLPIIAAISYYGRPKHHQTIKKCVTRLSRFRSPTGRVYDAWSGMKLYPALLALYAAGLPAISAENWPLLRMLLWDIQIQFDDHVLPLVERVNASLVIGRRIGRLLPGMNDRSTPVSDHLLGSIRPAVQQLIPAEDHEKVFDQFEFVIAIAYSDVLDKESAPIGRFGWRQEVSNNYLQQLFPQIQHPGSPMGTGLFPGAAPRYTNAVQRVRAFVADGRWQRY